MQAFHYTPERMRALQKTISTQRLQPYLDAANGDPTVAFSLYVQNTRLSASFYGANQGLEITLRNSIHDILTEAFDRSAWWESGFLHPEQVRPLEQAKSDLLREGKSLDPGRIVAELPFGFWTGLTGPKYTDLWRVHLVKAFPNRTLQRADAHERLDTIRKLRNRIAHHEPILNRPLRKDFNWILDAIAWICPVTARWVRTYSPFPMHLSPA